MFARQTATSSARRRLKIAASTVAVGKSPVNVVKPSAVPQRRVPAFSDSAPGRETLYTLRQRARSVHARGRVAETLYSAALDMLGDDGELQPAERQRLTQFLTTPVSEAAYEAVDTLLRELAQALDSVPPPLRAAITPTQHVTRIDFE